ncbi:hypothetical protein FNF27_04121 [Cafeteria roenbergensis]|uniref:FHA domain-containing protein n=1 Tax=Cafeteria roenbergensis TaxID=33653 RepID=A0A5A8D7E2_CAFRO|nr:hypothetical protein FNF29_04750 [Cafeteria roenbergensis]KAA0160180.1 hypothetical protein FNF31_04490 [Cafeteria roenbergensis]KAA0174329.1 hypothetical protein FNF27_04121 [Cafeteria roenbergensis]|mmetsp:Transcript_11720/g.45685  ORF Transcript_11720/g.45685 Transcript_11720/m.45685 type:complete len:165 (-) Transcript_11720:312-806(-)|eukprot:KAA0151275.1 hypothetical protein FNF29_04750 [Cafeteria roenbergensis]
MAYLLTITNGRGLGTKFIVKGITTLGRERVDVLLDRDDTVISRAHAVIEVTPSEGLVVFSDRSQHGSVVIRRTGERLHVKGRTSGAGDPTGSLLLFEGDQIVLGGVTLLLEKLTPSSLKEEEIEEEAAAVVAGFGGAAAPHAVTDGVATGAGVTGPRGPDSSTL